MDDHASPLAYCVFPAGRVFAFLLYARKDGKSTVISIKKRISSPYFSKPDLSGQREKKYNTDMPERKTGERCLKGMMEHDGEVPEE